MAEASASETARIVVARDVHTSGAGPMELPSPAHQLLPNTPSVGARIRAYAKREAFASGLELCDGVNARRHCAADTQTHSSRSTERPTETDARTTRTR